jgi:hypothetical protein
MMEFISDEPAGNIERSKMNAESSYSKIANTREKISTSWFMIERARMDLARINIENIIISRYKA